MEYFITSAGIPVHVNESKKDGSAILFLHGYLETLYIWEKFIDLFPPQYRLISIDIPCHGLTGMPSEVFSPLFSNSFLSQLLDKLSVERCCIISHSSGYYMAFSFARAFPDRVSSIISIDSSYSSSDIESLFIKSALNSIQDGTFSHFVSQYIPKMYYRLNLRDCDDRVEETIEICETHDTLALESFFKGISSFFSNIIIDDIIPMPVVHIFGQYNYFSPVIPEGSYIVPDSGMNSFIEKPDEVFHILSSKLTL